MPGTGLARSSKLSKMTRSDSSDEAVPHEGDNSHYHETKHTESVPTKSGIDEATRPHFHSNADFPSSRPPSSLGGDLEEADARVVEMNKATPSATSLDISAKVISRPSIESTSPGFTYSKTATMGKRQPSPQITPDHPAQSSRPAIPSFFEKPNQEHQSSVCIDSKGPTVGSTSQGLSGIISWLGSWLTLNLQAPSDLQKHQPKAPFQGPVRGQALKHPVKSLERSRNHGRPGRSPTREMSSK